jgi:hypothetical protein
MRRPHSVESVQFIFRVWRTRLFAVASLELVPSELAAYAACTIGFFAAPADNLVLSPRRGQMSPESSEQLQAISEIRFRILEEVQRRPDLALAMHEAGQAFVYEFNDIRVKRCQLAGEPIDGTTELLHQNPVTKYSLWPHIVSIMAGAAARHILDERGAMTSATADMHRVADCVETVGINQHLVEELIVEAAKAASIIIMKNFAAVMKIADFLERKRRIEGDEIRQIVREQKEIFFQT